MEASSTTLNIAGPATKVNHNHKPNFGRYVADCPKCVVLHPNGPPLRARKTKVKHSEVAVDSTAALTAEQIAEIVAKNAPAGAMTMDQVMMVIKALREPDPEDAEKKRKEKERIRINRENMIAVTKLEEQEKQRRYANCNHRKENGRPAWVGQVHSDGMFHPVCSHCAMEGKPVAPRQDQMQMGVS